MEVYPWRDIHAYPSSISIQYIHPVYPSSISIIIHHYPSKVCNHAWSQVLSKAFHSKCTSQETRQKHIESRDFSSANECTRKSLQAFVAASENAKLQWFQSQFRGVSCIGQTESESVKHASIAEQIEHDKPVHDFLMATII